MKKSIGKKKILTNQKKGLCLYQIVQYLKL